MPTYRLQDTNGAYLGLLEHPAPNLDARDVVVLDDGREAVITARIGAGRGSRFVAILEILVVPPDSQNVVP